MNSSSKKILASLIAIILAAWFYATPTIALSGMRRAAEAKDSEKLSSYINYPALKESIKANFNAMILEQASKERSSPYAGLGALIANAIIGPMVDSMVSPEGIALMMRGERPKPAQESKGEPTKASEPADITTSYDGFNSYVVLIKQKHEPESKGIKLILNRDGIFSWKLSSIRLPF